MKVMKKKTQVANERPKSLDFKTEHKEKEAEETVVAEVDGDQEKVEKQESNERKGRIYLKNLVYDTNESMLRKLCTPFGEIKDISIPLNETNNKPKGFAFVEFTNKNSALKAINELNDKKWKGRELSASLAVDKRRYLESKGVQPEVTTDIKMGDDIQIVKQNETKKTKGESKKGEKPEKVEKTAEELEMEKLDQLVLQNMAELGGEFEFDEESEEGTGTKTKEEDGNTVKEIDLGKEKMIEESLNKGKKQSKQEDYKVMLEDVEKSNVIKQKKKNENEDLTQTCFFRGVAYETNEKELYKFMKDKIGEIVYLKMVKFKADETKHNGNGFVKFKDKKIADRLIEITTQFNKGEYIPKAGDPKLEISGIRIQFFPALKKDEAKKITLEREKEIDKKNNPEEKKERKNKRLNIDQLIAKDKQGKRRLAFSRLGFFDQIEEEKLGDADKEQRRSHKMEKMAKMENPNYFISEKRVILKNVDKKIDELQIRKLTTEILSKRLKEKEIKKSKIFSDIKIIASKSEENTNKSSVILS